MHQVVKFPDMRPPPRDAPIRELPTPAQYRQMTPAIIAAERGPPPPRLGRKRRWAWFAVAVDLHAALFIAIWLSPPLRLKWSPSPDAWVPVVSLPPPAPTTPAATSETAMPVTSKPKTRKSPPPPASNQEKPP